MSESIEALSEKEKETLRLLLAGHDAKSSARELGLSVHTVNERLRGARRKLGVSSSREAARILGEAEGGAPNSSVTSPPASPPYPAPNSSPNSLGHTDLGVAPAGGRRRIGRQGAGLPLAWLAGGMLIMSLIIAAVVLSTALQGDGATQTPTAVAAAAATPIEETDASAAAREWIALVDAGNWKESWNEAAALFQAQVTAQQWAQTVEPVREPLGAVTSRTLISDAESKTLPGMPEGDYRTLQFATAFAAMPGAVETVILAQEEGAWKVIGYFIR